jgi:hypothetical protein
MPTLNDRSLFGGLFNRLSRFLTALFDTINMLTDEVIKESKDTVDTVKKLKDTLKPMVDAFDEIKKTKPSGSISEKPTCSEAGRSSSSSCAPRAVSNCNVCCTKIATTTMGGLQRRDDRDACITACEAPVTKCGANVFTSKSTVISKTTVSRFVCAPTCIACDNIDRGPPLGVPTLAGYSKAPMILCISQLLRQQNH